MTKVIGNINIKNIYNKFKSKYILLIGDDDRINVDNFKKIFKYLEFDYSE